MNVSFGQQGCADMYVLEIAKACIALLVLVGGQRCNVTGSGGSPSRHFLLRSGYTFCLEASSRCGCCFLGEIFPGPHWHHEKSPADHENDYTGNMLPQ